MLTADNTLSSMIIKELRGWRLFSAFSAEEIKMLAPLLEPEYHVVGGGETVISVGDKGDRLYLVKYGRFEERRIHGEEIHGLGLYKPGGFFGLFAAGTSKRSPVNVVAIEDGELISVKMDKALDDSRFKERLLKALFREARDLSARLAYRVDVLSPQTVREKLMVYFEAMKDKHGKSEFKISMTQGELADYIDVNRSNVSLELKRMRQEGILDIKGNRTYEILSWDAWTQKGR